MCTCILKVHIYKSQVLSLHLLLCCSWRRGILALGADPFAVPVEQERYWHHRGGDEAERRGCPGHAEVFKHGMCEELEVCQYERCIGARIPRRTGKPAPAKERKKVFAACAEAAWIVKASMR